ncbi:MAG: T9SS type A sorting domain-containing protein [Phycisphaerae bacterium]|nr:T9SS type A sorting domain-containing protein [Saprospiraceae bacterium]
MPARRERAWADSRCLQNGTSSLSAFIRIAKPGDADDSLSLDLNVPLLPTGMEPIDSLQRLYNQWKTTIATSDPGFEKPLIYPNPASGWLSVVLKEKDGLLELFDLTSRRVFSKKITVGENRFAPALPNGVYFAKITVGGHIATTHKIIWRQ